METIFFMAFLHYIGDFPLQGSYLAENKGNDDYLLFVHSFIWAGLLSTGLLYVGLFETWKCLFLIVGHFIIDRIKARGKLDSLLTQKHALLFDQFLHFIQIIIVTWWM